MCISLATDPGNRWAPSKVSLCPKKKRNPSFEKENSSGTGDAHRTLDRSWEFRVMEWNQSHALTFGNHNIPAISLAQKRLSCELQVRITQWRGLRSLLANARYFPGERISRHWPGVDSGWGQSLCEGKRPCEQFLLSRNVLRREQEVPCCFCASHSE